MIWQEEQNQGVDVYIIAAADTAATISMIIRVMAIHPSFLMIRPVPSDVTYSGAMFMPHGHALTTS